MKILDQLFKKNFHPTPALSVPHACVVYVSWQLCATDLSGIYFSDLLGKQLHLLASHQHVGAQQNLTH